ncbi:MAG: hypothetical protein U0Q55_04065 [Vicinamibacterales bacterium]
MLKALRRRRAAVAVVCIAAVAFSGLLLGLAGIDAALLEPQWTFLPDATAPTFAASVPDAGEQPLSLFALSVSRGPPVG